MWVLAFFTNTGSPATGLNPTVRIRDLSTNALVVTDQSMTEVGDGFYKYNFTTYDAKKDYSIRSDGGSTLVNSERYVYAGNESFIQDITDAVWNEQLSNHLDSGSTGQALDNTGNAVTAVYFGYGS